MCGNRAERLSAIDKMKLIAWRCTEATCGEKFWTEMKKDDE